MSDEVQVFKPRSQFDRTLARLDQQRRWEYLPQCTQADKDAIDRLERYEMEAMELSRTDGITIAMKLRCMSLAADFMEKARKTREVTFHDRCAPRVERVDHQAVVAMLPIPEDERLAAPVTDDGKTLAEILDTQRQILAQLSSIDPASRPGLFLVRGVDQ